MMKKNVLFMLAAAFTLFASATDRFYIADLAIAPGETRTVEILLDNDVEYTAFQCDLYLPEGLTANEESFALTARKKSSHTLSVSPFPNGAYRLMSYSLQLHTYSGNSGPLVTFEVTASNDFSGPASIALSNTFFTTEAGVEAIFDNEACNVLIRGDINNDGIVNTGDVAALIKLLLNGEATPPSADANGDGNIGVGDVAAIVNMLLVGN